MVLGWGVGVGVLGLVVKVCWSFLLLFLAFRFISSSGEGRQSMGG